jgi:ribonuclease P protein component
MLAKPHRLTKKKDFDLVFAKGRGLKDRFLWCKAAANGLPVSRFGFVVSKKISTKAVVRNKVKRRLRRAIALELLKIKPSFDVVVVALPGIEGQEFDSYRETVAALCKKMHLYV